MPRRSGGSASGQDAYPDLHGKAAAPLHSLVSNHALVDGNERLAAAGCLVFLDLNGQRPATDQDSLVDLVVAVASGALTDLEKIAEHLWAWDRAPLNRARRQRTSEPLRLNVSAHGERRAHPARGPGRTAPGPEHPSVVDTDDAVRPDAIRPQR